MTVVVIGGSGLIGSNLAEVLVGAQVVVDVSNSPSFEDGPAWDFFTTATGNLLTAGEPVLGTREVGGPARYRLDELVRARLRAQSDDRNVATDPQAPYFGVVLDDWLVDNAAAPVR